MSTYENIEGLCKEKGIAVTALEKELGFGRGSIGKMKKGGKTSYVRLQAIADYFGVPVDALIDREDLDRDLMMELESKRYYEDVITEMKAQEMFQDKRLRALHHIKKNMDSDRFQIYYDMLVKMYQKEHPTDDYDFDE